MKKGGIFAPAKRLSLQQGFSSEKFIDYCVFRLIYKVEKFLKNIQKKHCEELKRL